MGQAALSTLASVPGVMTGAEFCRRADAWSRPLLTAQTEAEARRWRSVRIELDGTTFCVLNAYPVVPDLKRAGFRFNGPLKAWQTDSPHAVARCPELLRKAKGPARDALRSVLRVAAASDTFARAKARLASGEVDRMKVLLDRETGPAMLSALREAVGILAACDADKATVRNGEGFSKADTEVGHTLVIMGMTTFTQAAIALRLAQKYRKQLPPHITALTSEEATQDDFIDEVALVVPEPVPAAALTLTEAQELVVYPAVADVLDDLRQTPYAILDGTPEPDARRLPPFMRETRTPVARIEGGAVLLLVEKDKRPVALEVRLAG